MRQQPVKSKGFYGALFSLAVPIMLQSMISYGLNMTDTIMLGRLGEDVLSASAIANQPYFILTLFIFGLGSGTSVLISQYWGKRDTGSIQHVVGMGLAACVGISALITALVLLFPGPVLSLYSDDPLLIAMGSEYLRIVALSYVVNGISATLLFNLRSVENVLVPLSVSAGALVVNTFLNWCLIYGNLGMPELGLRGAAVATVIARAVELVAVLIYVFGFEKAMKLKLREIFRINLPLLRDFLKYSLPVVLNETFWGMGISVQAMIIGHFGSAGIAAYNITTICERFAFFAISGISNSSAVMIGKEVGAGEGHQAKRHARGVLMISLGIGVTGALVIGFCRPLLLKLFTLSEGSYEQAMNLLLVMAMYFSVKTITGPLIIGILRGGGDSRFAAVVDIIFLWILSIPLGILSTRALGLPIHLVYALMMLDEPVKMTIALLRLRGGGWIRDVTREQPPAELREQM